MKFWLPPLFGKKTEKKLLLFVFEANQTAFCPVKLYFFADFRAQSGSKMFEHITNHIHKQSKQGCPDPSILEGLQQEF